MPVYEHRVVFHAPEVPGVDFFLLDLSGRETLSQPYEFDAVVQTPEPLGSDELEKLFTTGVSVEFEGDEPRRIHGVVRAAEFQPDARGVGAVYTLAIVPRFWYLTQTTRSRAFLNKSAIEIVRTVLTECGLEDGTDFAVETTRTPSTREYTVQFEETDLNFVSRLLEYEGIFYYFEHGDEREKLHLVDGVRACRPLDGDEAIPYRPTDVHADSASHVREIRRRIQTVPRKVVARDFNDALPKSVVTDAEPQPVRDATWPVDRVGFGLHVEFGEHLKTSAEAQGIARIRAEEIGARRDVYVGRARVRGLHAGHRFTLEDHAFPEMDKEYLVTTLGHRFEHRGEGDGGDGGGDGLVADLYEIEFEAIPASVPFRPSRLAPRPQIAGLLHAKIAGDHGGTPAPIDDDGRYHVVLPFDTVGNGRPATCRITLAQALTGGGYGLQLPLHQGATVLLAHIGGDPDRPVIVAGLPTPETPSPFKTAQGSRGGLVTRSAVRIEYDDDA
jgi:type VI secretion system secreted protein VgrG